jgi:enterobactin synthetase component F
MPTVRRHLARFPGVRLSNEYGPTETTVWSTVYDCDAPDGMDALPIGRPLPGTLCRVLSASGALCPIGATGELYIGGAGVSRGYLGAPAQTAERFVAGLLAQDGEKIFYRTGDRVRWRNDGQLGFVGRDDTQVKIRGYRVELAEVQARIAEHDLVREVVVTAPLDPSGARRLLAHLVPEQWLEPETEDDRIAWKNRLTSSLRIHLKEALPGYMCPAAFVLLERMPLGANGKVDRHALPPPEAEDLRAASYVAPASDYERRVHELWRALLSLERIGVHDSFFDIGGHSLLVMKLIGAIEQTFGVAVTVKELFVNSTISTQAELIEAAEGVRRAMARVDKRRSTDGEQAELLL